MRVLAGAYNMYSTKAITLPTSMNVKQIAVISLPHNLVRYLVCEKSSTNDSTRKTLTVVLLEQSAGVSARLPL
eukprot:COSAG01_NODE_2166_length_8254_cov_9.294421_6_plen_73_part_00